MTLATLTAFGFLMLSAPPPDDGPLPYGDDDAPGQKSSRKLPRRSEWLDEASDDLAKPSDPTPDGLPSARLDDPNIGVSAEVLLGALLLESSLGRGVEPRIGFGVRGTWEWGRTLLADEYWRELPFVDLTFAHTDWADGTKEINSSVGYNYFTLAPAVGIPLGKLPLAAYAQVGAGLAYQASTLQLVSQVVTLSTVKFLFQYGAGLRFRPALTASKKIRLSFRVEVTRLRRGYMDDTLLGGSVGLTF